MKNRHPADELAEVRAEIRTLKDREGVLRGELLECSKVGVDFVARFVPYRRRRLDFRALEKHFGADVLEPFMVETEFQRLDLVARRDADV